MTQLQEKQQQEQFLNVINDMLEEAAKQGASSAEAGLTAGSGLSVTARLGDVETIEHHHEQSISITVYNGQQKGSASSNDLNPASIKKTVNAACTIARYANEDPYAGLPDTKDLASEINDLQIHHPWDISVEQAIELAINCENSARDYDAEISNSEGATVDTFQGISVLGNSKGFLNAYPSSRHSLSCSVLAQRGDSMQRDYWYSVARKHMQLESPESVGKKAAQRALQRLQARSLSTRQCPVLYTPETAAGLLSSLIGAISGGSLYRKSTFLLDALDQRIFPENIHIYEQPLLCDALGSAPYDSEGVTTQNRDLVKDGVLTSYVLSSYSARKLGMQTTGNAGGVRNLQINSSDKNFEQLIEEMHQGLIITEMMGQGINRVTGDYSRGAAGFWVENGEIQYPVEEITVAGNLKAMFQGITAVGNDVDYRRNIRCGSVLINQMSIAGE